MQEKEGRKGKKGKAKKAIEPVVATVGLIGISLALFAIVFIWSRSFVAEQITKFGSPIEQACTNVGFDVDVGQGTGINFTVTNTGNVRIYKIRVKYIYEGRSEIKDYFINPDESALEPGATGIIMESQSPQSIQKLEIIPLLLGEGVKSKNAYLYACEDKVQIKYL
ncbi:MAG: hypothetical protein QW199_02460 [Candidatus Pacearchaeota archaeon]